MAGSDGVQGPRTQQSRGRWGRFKRGVKFSTVGMVLLGGASLIFLPLPLIAAVAIGGVAGGAIANATGEEVKK